MAKKERHDSRRKVVAIVQARMGSTRLPGKVLMPLNNKPALWHVLNRVSAAETVHETVVATSTNLKDRPIFEHCTKWGFAAFAGDEENVLDRVVRTAIAFNADVVVDITADCPLVDPEEIDRMVRIINSVYYSARGVCYVSNIGMRSWPDGFDIQVYKAVELSNLLHRSEADKSVLTQHTGWNLLNKLAPYQRMGFVAPERYVHPEWGLTLDTKEDWELLDTLFTDLFDKFKHYRFTYSDIMEYIIQNQELLEINKHIVRKEPGE